MITLLALELLILLAHFGFILSNLRAKPIIYILQIFQSFTSIILLVFQVFQILGTIGLFLKQFFHSGFRNICYLVILLLYILHHLIRGLLDDFKYLTFLLRYYGVVVCSTCGVGLLLRARRDRVELPRCFLHVEFATAYVGKCVCQYLHSFDHDVISSTVKLSIVFKLHS
jgi:hypothetical protein